MDYSQCVDAAMLTLKQHGGNRLQAARSMRDVARKHAITSDHPACRIVFILIDEMTRADFARYTADGDFRTVDGSRI